MMLGVRRPLPFVSLLAVVALMLTGAFVIAISSPPLFNIIFGEEDLWEPWGVAYGIVYLAAAVAFGTVRTRLALAACLILAMTGFTTALGRALDLISSVLSMMRSPGSFTLVQPVEVMLFTILSILSAVAIVGVIEAAHRWEMLSRPESGYALPAVILAGIGFALGLGIWGGDYGILLDPIRMPWYDGIRSWLPLPHFVAAAALVLGGRFATPGAIAISGGGLLLSLSVLMAIVSFGAWEIAKSVVPWLLFVLGYLLTAALLLDRRRSRLFARFAA